MEEEKLPWVIPEERRLLEKEPLDEEGQLSKAQRAVLDSVPRSSMSILASTLLAFWLLGSFIFFMVSSNTTSNSGNDTLSSVSAGDNYMWGKHQAKTKPGLSTTPLGSTTSTSTSTSECTDLIAGAFVESCAYNKHFRRGIVATAHTPEGVQGIGISKQRIGTSGELPYKFFLDDVHPVVANKTNQCERQGYLSQAPDWVEMRGIVHYEELDQDSIVWSIDGTTCLWTRRTGAECDRILQKLMTKFEGVEGIRRDLYTSKLLC